MKTGAVLMLPCVFILTGYLITKANFRLRSFLASFLSILVSAILPVALLSLLFYLLKFSQEEVVTFSKTNRSYLVALAVFTEEACKLLSLFYLSNNFNRELNFYDRSAVGLFFGMIELAYKVVSNFTSISSSFFGLLFKQDFNYFFFATLALGIHAITFMYPRDLRDRRTILFFGLLCCYHTYYNLSILRLGTLNGTLDQSNAFSGALQVMLVPWILLVLAYVLLHGPRRFRPAIWQ